MKKNITTKKGFSIGEVMVAMFILIFGIVSAVFLTSQSVNQIGSSRNAIIATLLAQEGTELVKNVRDNNVTQETCGGGTDRCTAFDKDSGYGWPSYSSGGNTYIVQYDKNTPLLSVTSDTDLYNLFVDTDTGFYSHTQGGGETTPFQRKIYIKYVNKDGDSISGISTDEEKKHITAQIASVVIWGKGEFPANIDDIETSCKIGKDCVFTRTNLTSWINYGE